MGIHLRASMLQAMDPALAEQWLQTLTEEEAEALNYEWRHFWARKEQLQPEDPEWIVWLLLAGRGFGKTRTGAEWIKERVENNEVFRIALVAPTTADVRKVMVEGPSGILAVSPPWNRPVYEPSKRLLTWPNGAIATTYSAEEPERLRGPEHDAAWCDELAAWRYPETWDMLMFGLRLGKMPRVCVTTTPKPNQLVRDLIADPSTRITRGKTRDNIANLAKTFLTKIVNKYEGTRLGRQELDAEVLDDTPGALWTYKMLDASRFKIDWKKLDPNNPLSVLEQLPKMQRIVVAVDPSGTKGDSKQKKSGMDDGIGDDVGITVQGKGIDGQGYLLEDLTVNASPAVWARLAVGAYHKWGADLIVAERNFGGAMVEHTIRSADPNVNYKEVVASRGKSIRAEPVASLYEQGKIHHVGSFAELETQMTQMTTNGFTGKGSPDRLDAAVWGFTELMLDDLLPPPAVIIHATHFRTRR